MEKEIVFSIGENEECGFVAEASGYTVRTEADSLDELVRKIHYAVLSEFEEQDRPTLINMRLPDMLKKND